MVECGGCWLRHDRLFPLAPGRRSRAWSRAEDISHFYTPDGFGLAGSGHKVALEFTHTTGGHFAQVENGKYIAAELELESNP